MRQLFVIGLLTMMKASNAIYRYDEEDYVPDDVDGAVLMAASYTKGLPIEDPNVEKEHNHDNNYHEDEDMSVGNDEYFPIETNEIEEVYVSYPTKEDEWIKEWEVNENIPEDECIYTECTKGNYCQEISCLNDICYRIFYDSNWQMVSEPCEEKAEIVDVVKITNFGVDISEDVESYDDQIYEQEIESNVEDEESDDNAEVVDSLEEVEDTTVEVEAEESEVVDVDNDDDADDSADDSDDTDDLAEDSNDEDEENSDASDEESDGEIEVDESVESAEETENVDDSENNETSDDDSEDEVEESDDESDDDDFIAPENPVVCNETCSFNDCSADVGGQVCWRQDCDDQCGKKTCTQWMKDNATGEWYGQYCSSGEQLPAIEETEMTIEQVMSMFKESVETYGDTIKQLTELTGADADIADQVLSIAENPEQLLNQTAELESLVDPVIIETLVNGAIQGMQTQVESLLNNTEVMEDLTSIGEELLSDPDVSAVLSTPEAQQVIIQASQVAGLLANPETAGATISGAVDMVGELIDSLELQEEVKAPLAEIFGVFSRGVKNSGLNRKDRRP